MWLVYSVLRSHYVGCSDCPRAPETFKVALHIAVVPHPVPSESLALQDGTARHGTARQQASRAILVSCLTLFTPHHPASINLSRTRALKTERAWPRTHWRTQHTAHSHNPCGRGSWIVDRGSWAHGHRLDIDRHVCVCVVASRLQTSLACQPASLPMPPAHPPAAADAYSHETIVKQHRPTMWPTFLRLAGSQASKRAPTERRTGGGPAVSLVLRGTRHLIAAPD